MDDIRIGYLDAARAVIAADGIQGLFERDLKTRILTNNLQGIMFSILWKLFLDLYVHVPFSYFSRDLMSLPICGWNEKTS